MQGETINQPSYSLAALAQGWRASGDVGADVTRFLVHHGCPATANHVAGVAREAASLAHRFDIDPYKAKLAGWLHDISAVIPNEQRIQAAQDMGLYVLPEERQFPMILHQRLSLPIAHKLFGVTDPAVLNAIECHTTLRANPSPLDLVVFVADKIAWDQAGTPPYLDDVTSALDESLDAAALAYIDYLWQRRDTLRVVHPWLVDARMSLIDRR